ncbi:MAG: pyridine nucleotide-disulfide oxidoreductase [Candidatus Margulisbacteria bacterium GWF2_35_9]|nr:MAG: pyridine nucleotide-disulfide oxidoreductase [Candidatus Margulisbacteria bacterium GWF2_35_9]
MRVVIVGGVAGGASSAARLRRLDENIEIIMIEKGKEISYANCGIPYYIGNKIKEREKLVVVDKKDFKSLLNVDVRTENEVVSIDRKKKTVLIKDTINNNEYIESYDTLVLSPGGIPVRPPIPGINDQRIFTIRNLQDMDAIKTYLNENQVKSAVIVGAGFIGLEVAENLKELGMNVSIVELADQVMNIMDYEMATVIHKHLHSKNIALYLKDGVTEFKSSDTKLDVVLRSNRKISADIVILSIGIKPEIALAKDAKLEIGALGGILVNEIMQTNDPSIYALGDACEIKDCVSDANALIPLANSANKQGRIVADNICGKHSVYECTPGTSIAKVFDMTVAFTGNNEKQLKRNNVSFEKVYLQPSSHAGYYPDAFPMIMKLLYNTENYLILGAQIIGPDGVDKRIDVISSLIQFKKNVYDLATLELSYAPPYNSAKDPVNIAAMIAINQIEGLNNIVHWNEVESLKKEGAVFVDVRSKLEYELGHMENSINIPVDELRDRQNELDHTKKIIVYCNQGKKGYFAFSILSQNNFDNVYNLAGGYNLYHYTTLAQENIGIFDDVYIDKRDDINRVIETKGNVIQVDACGLQCPGPIVRLSNEMNKANIGDVLEIVSTDPGFKNDVGIWSERTNNTLLEVKDVDKKVYAKIQKGKALTESNLTIGSIPHDKTMVVFSSDLDRALAAFVIANGSAAMNRKVTMFFTFWGLNILRKSEHVNVHKSVIDKMFGFMMPKGSKKLSLSKMHMMGMGTQMMKMVMKNKNIDSLETMIELALQSGIRIVACQMSMDMMGIKKEELIDGIEIGGVASYLGAAETADTNLFI